MINSNPRGTKKMFILTKSMGHEKHMVLLVGFLD
jgi:hypothetical protein